MINSSKRHLKAVRNGYGAVVRHASRRDPFSDDQSRNDVIGNPIAANELNFEGPNVSSLDQPVIFGRSPDKYLPIRPPHG